MLSREEILKDLEETGALLKGHFLLSSGLHSGGYVQCASLLKYPATAGKLCEELADKVAEYKPDIVVGPALGGVIVSYELARALGKPGIFTERKEKKMELRRNFEINPGDRVLVVEDVVTTGGSVKEVIEIVSDRGGELIAVASLIDRSGGKADFGVPFESLISLNLAVYQPDECPLCKEGSKAVKPGSRE
ncbi:orotate phosphoribosyltransferase [Iocasia frigidifontis]|uniref:Orotate phosphoribosyltransferase n=1 Tax=Iocasia fonsfrigidae TaxID=2682810 RepID=A0A8A7KKS4_9FIRM|nr:orotate phosphoribosyltransferase [Iocasia fonsfrigidae]QTL98452.1 orotate phosphoribosyltransferase [Iocasia fonsfrigidae]